MSESNWRKWLAIAIAVGFIILGMVFRNRLGADFWPLDQSTIGPNIVASVLTWAVVLIVSVLLYPPWRRAAHRFLDSKLETIHYKLDAHQTERQEHYKRVEEHNWWVAQHVAVQHKAITGEKAEPHPHFDLPNTK